MVIVFLLDFCIKKDVSNQIIKELRKYEIEIGVEDND